MPQRLINTIVGFFMLATMFCLTILAFKVSGLTSLFPEKTYNLFATFDDIGGLKVRSAVKIGGVQIGEVSRIDLNPTTFRAVVKMKIYKEYNEIPDDSSAGILTAGLLGDNYISITPMYNKTFLKNNGEILETRSAMILEKLIGQLIYKIGNSDNANVSNTTTETSNDSGGQHATVS